VIFAVVVRCFRFAENAVCGKIGGDRKTGAWRALVGRKIDGRLLGYQLVVVWVWCIAGSPRTGGAAATVARRVGTKEMGAAAL